MQQTPAHDVRFVPRRVAGRGGMGVVLEAWDEVLRRRVALKVLPFDGSDRDVAMTRALREARNASRLMHPNIVRVYDVGVGADGFPFIAMEYVDGLPLRRLVLPLPQDVALFLAAQVADALVAAHQLGIVHRDIKPGNLMLCDDERGARVVVLDFGVSRCLASDETHSRDGRFVGTARYAAPEQALGGTATPAMDVYALGCVLFELLTGAAPFSSDSDELTMLRHVHTEVPDPRTVVDIEPQIAELVVNCLRKDPEQRPTASQVREVLLRHVRLNASTSERTRAALRAAGATPIEFEAPARHRPAPSDPAQNQAAAVAVPNDLSTATGRHIGDVPQTASHRTTTVVVTMFMALSVAGGIWLRTERSEVPEQQLAPPQFDPTSNVVALPVSREIAGDVPATEQPPVRTVHRHDSWAAELSAAIHAAHIRSSATMATANSARDRARSSSSGDLPNRAPPPQSVESAAQISREQPSPIASPEFTGASSTRTATDELAQRLRPRTDAATQLRSRLTQ